jgi:hypothetical protein
MFKYFDPQSCKYLNHFKTNVKGTVNFIQWLRALTHHHNRGCVKTRQRQSSSFSYTSTGVRSFFVFVFLPNPTSKNGSLGEGCVNKQGYGKGESKGGTRSFSSSKCGRGRDESCLCIRYKCRGHEHLMYNNAMLLFRLNGTWNPVALNPSHISSIEHLHIMNEIRTTRL